MEYGLIGEKLGHSYSKIIHEIIANYQYELHPVPKDEIHNFMTEKNFKAINVTIPYKETVIPYLYKIDKQAEKIGAVNTIVNKNGKLYGYNTDCLGFQYMLEKHNIEIKNKNILILGTGGTQKTVKTVCESLGAKTIQIVSRNPKGNEIDYNKAKEQENTEIIINTTPVGMYPNNNNSPIEIKDFKNCCGVIDVIYNPFRTKLIQQAIENNIKAISGFEMLIAQAVYAAEYFTETKIDKEKIDKIYKDLKQKLENIILIGMPGSGKTQIGKRLETIIDKKFIDIDQEIEKETGQKIPEIFKTKGETYFREIEEKICQRYSAQNNLIISTGGGIIKRQENIQNLRQNGIIIYIKRPLEKLEIGCNRPLSTDIEALRKMEQERKTLYEKYMDIKVENISTIQDTAEKIKQEFIKNIQK